MRPLFCLLLMLLGTVAHAQTIRTQTGEHADFTRVVLTIPPGTDWNLGRTETGYGVRLEGVDGFEVADFWRLIPRDRITDMRIDEDTIELDVTCDCTATAVLDQPNILVIDVADGLPPEGSPFELALNTGPDQTAAPSDIAFPEFPRPSILPNPAPKRLITALDEQVERNERLTELEVSVAENLSRAASQGLLELRDDLRIAPETSDTTAVTREEVPAIEQHSGRQARPGIIARTSVDEGLAGVINGRNLLSEDLTCWPDELVDLNGWTDGRPFHEQLADRRAAITAEFDTIDPVAVENLSKLYVASGFGREALQTLQIDGRRSQQRNALTALAQIIDGDPVADIGLADQTACPGDAALWAALSTPPAKATDADPEGVARSFRRLPLPLQIHLGPKLADRLAAAGRPDIAELILQPDLSSASPSPESAVLISDMAHDGGDLGRATETLTTLAEEDPRATPEAILNLISLEIAQGTLIPDETITLAETLRFEHRRDPLGADLSAALIQAHLNNGNPSKAYEAFERFSADLDAETQRVLWNEVHLAAVEVASDTTFLSYSFDGNLTLGQPETLNAMAGRLLTLGFAERATDLLRDPATGSAMAERRYLRAIAAIQMNNFALAQAHLAGITTPRAKAILATGPDGILLQTRAVGEDADTADESQSAWRQGDWSELEGGEDALLSEVSARILGLDPVPIDPETPLANGRALVADAKAARSSLTALIDRFEAPLLSADNP